MTDTTKGPAITSANLPAAIAPGHTTAPTPSQVAHAATQIQDDSDIVARPLVTPDFTNLKPTNPAMSLKLCNRLALGGQWFQECLIKGFIVCKPTDVKDIPVTMTVKDNTVTYGDLIVMMMPREKYIGAIKHNENVAKQRVSRQAVYGAGQEHLASALNEVPGSRDNKSKIKLFQPDR